MLELYDVSLLGVKYLFYLSFMSELISIPLYIWDVKDARDYVWVDPSV